MNHSYNLPSLYLIQSIICYIIFVIIHYALYFEDPLPEPPVECKTSKMQHPAIHIYGTSLFKVHI